MSASFSINKRKVGNWGDCAIFSTMFSKTLVTGGCGAVIFTKNKKYYEISSVFPSRNHKYLAYCEDINGRRDFQIVIKDLEKNKIIEKNKIPSTGSLIWNKKSSGYFYLKKDPTTLVSNTLFFHEIGINHKKDKLIYKEEDNQFNLSISLSRTKRYLFLQASKTESNETWILDLENESFNLKCFLKRKNKHK